MSRPAASPRYEHSLACLPRSCCTAHKGTIWRARQTVMSIRPIGGMRRGVVTVNLGRRADQSERRVSRQADRRDRPDDRDEDDEHKDNDRKPRSRWPLIILGVVVAAVIGGIVYWLMTRGEV